MEYVTRCTTTESVYSLMTCNLPVCARRSEGNHNRRVCSSRRAAAGHRRDRRTDVLQEGQHGQLHLQKVASFIHLFNLASMISCFSSRFLKILNEFRVRRKVHSAPDKLNPMYQEASVKERPQISSPTLMESTATQACAPLTVAMAPSRTAPQVQMAAARK